MAQTANSENVKREVDGPDYVGALQLIRGPIASNRSETSSLGQENSTLFKRIDKQFGVHRGAATSFASIDNMQPEKRDDFLRSLLGLIKHAGYGKFSDLVDQAQAVTPPKPTGGEKAPLPEHPSDDSDLVTAGGDEAAPGEADGGASERAHATAGRTPLARARGHLQSVPGVGAKAK